MYNRENRDKRPNRSRDDRDRDRGPRPERAPLQWREGVHTVTHGAIQAVVNAANGDNGLIQSFTIGRIGREGRYSKYMALRDIADIRSTLDDLEAYLQAQEDKAG